MISYFIHRYGWTSHIFHDIHWTALEMTVRNLRYQSFYVKLAQGILPTRFFIHQYNKKESPLCPACQAQVETNEHLLQCPVYVNWRETLVESLTKFFLSTSTPDYISHFLISLIHSYFNGSVQENNCNDSDVFAKQNSIGWKNFFRGHITKSLQSAYEASGGTTDHWTYKFLKILWTNIKSLWDLRNAYEHGVDAHHKAHKRKQKLLRDLREIYDERQNIMAIDTEQFYNSPEEHLQEHRQHSQVQSWIMMMKKTIQHSKAQALQIAKSGTKNIHQYFHRIHHRSKRKNKKKPRNKPTKIKRTHQMYIHRNPNRTRLLSLIPEKSSVVLTPKQIQPQIPWEHRTMQRQSLITDW